MPDAHVSALPPLWIKHSYLTAHFQQVTQLKADIGEYCDSGTAIAAELLASRFDLDESAIKEELSSVFGDFGHLGGTKKEKRIADEIIHPVQPQVRVLGTRTDEKGKVVVVNSPPMNPICLQLHMCHRTPWWTFKSRMLWRSSCPTPQTYKTAIVHTRSSTGQ